MTDDPRDIIDLQDYRRRKPEERRSSFAVWGGEGERSRLALPLWRAIYLVGGERGALVWLESNDAGEGPPHSFFVLDLASESPRIEFPDPLPGGLSSTKGDAPLLVDQGPALAVYLGSDEGKRWFLLVDRGEIPREPLETAARDDLLFLAGECAGLVIQRRLHRLEGGAPDGGGGEDPEAGGGGGENETHPLHPRLVDEGGPDRDDR